MGRTGSAGGPYARRVEWNLPEAAKAGINKELVLQKLAERDRRPGADVEWG